MNKITEMVIAQATNEDGVVDYATLKEVWKDLTAYRSANKEAAAEAEKAANKATKAEKAVIGKAYVATLKEGDRVSYTANGEVVEATVGKQNKDAKSLHVILDAIPEGAKSTKLDRYPTYDKVIIPADFSVEAVA